MKLLGKAMKIAQPKNHGKNGTLSSLLVNNCETPHFIAKSEHSDNDEPFQQTNPSQSSLRKSTRLHRLNTKYFNNYF